MSEISQTRAVSLMPSGNRWAEEIKGWCVVTLEWRSNTHERDSPAWWCHILFDSFVCKQATEDRQEMFVGEGGVLPVVSWGVVSCYPILSSFFCFPLGETSASVSTLMIPWCPPPATDKNILTSFLFPWHSAILFWISESTVPKVERDMTGFLLIITQLNVAHDISAAGLYLHSVGIL